MTLHRGKFVCGLGEEGAVADTEHNLGRNADGCGCHGGATVLEYGLAFVQACGAWLVLRIKYQQKKEAKKKIKSRCVIYFKTNFGYVICGRQLQFS